MADFNPLANFNQGLVVAQNIRASQRQNQIGALQQGIAQQTAQGGFNPNNSLEFQQLSTLDPNASAQILSDFNNLDKSRKKALFQDAREARKALESGDGEGFLSIVSDRLDNIERLGGDPSQTMNVLNAFNSGDVQGALGMLNRTEQLGIESGMLSDPLKGQAKPSNFAPEISPVQTDPETGQKFIVRTDKNTRESVRIDVEGAMGEATNKTEQRMIRRELIRDAGKVSKESFSSLKNIKSSISTMNEAITAIDKGASTGAIERFLPSFTEATLELENAASRMGLDVISATTFGALSEGELRLAMDTALPTKMKPVALRKWLVSRRDAKRKMARELNKMAITLGKGKTTIAEYLEKNATMGAGISSNQDIATLSDEDLFK